MWSWVRSKSCFILCTCVRCASTIHWPSQSYYEASIAYSHHILLRIIVEFAHDILTLLCFQFCMFWSVKHTLPWCPNCGEEACLHMIHDRLSFWPISVCSWNLSKIRLFCDYWSTRYTFFGACLQFSFSYL